MLSSSWLDTGYSSKSNQVGQTASSTAIWLARKLELIRQLTAALPLCLVNTSLMLALCIAGLHCNSLEGPCAIAVESQAGRSDYVSAPPGSHFQALQASASNIRHKLQSASYQDQIRGGTGATWSRQDSPWKEWSSHS